MCDSGVFVCAVVCEWFCDCVSVSVFVCMFGDTGMTEASVSMCSVLLVTCCESKDFCHAESTCIHASVDVNVR